MTDYTKEYLPDWTFGPETKPHIDKALHYMETAICALSTCLDQDMVLAICEHMICESEVDFSNLRDALTQLENAASHLPNIDQTPSTN